jgi:hypothetical protein
VSHTCQTIALPSPDPSAGEVTVARTGGRVDDLSRRGGAGGRLALAVGTGLPVMAAMLREGRDAAVRAGRQAQRWRCAG